MIDDHNVPSLVDMLRFAENVRTWLEQDPVPIFQTILYNHNSKKLDHFIENNFLAKTAQSSALSTKN